MAIKIAKNFKFPGSSDTYQVNAVKLDGVDATAEELNYMQGVTANVQEQLNTKGMFLITAVKSATSDSIDKTMAEIEAAYQAGMTICCKYSSANSGGFLGILQLVSRNSSASWSFASLVTATISVIVVLNNTTITETIKMLTDNKGTITGVSANGTSIATSGDANIPAASTTKYGVTKLSSSTSSTSTTLAATASAVKAAYDLANTAKTNATTAQSKADEAHTLASGIVALTFADIDAICIMPRDPGLYQDDVMIMSWEELDDNGIINRFEPPDGNGFFYYYQGDYFAYGASGHLVLPEDLGTNTGLEEGLLQDCTWITGVTIPKSVTYIPGSCFRGCINLETVVFHNNVTELQSGCFRDCTSLRNITLPSSVTFLGPSLFNGTGITHLTLPSGCLNATGSGALSIGIAGLTSVTIEPGNTKLEGQMFYGCSSLTEIIIPEGVLTIKDRAFVNCPALTHIVIPKSLTSLGRYLFEDSLALTSVEYNGTKAQWNAIASDATPWGDLLWCDYSNITQVICSDGTITL